MNYTSEQRVSRLLLPYLLLLPMLFFAVRAGAFSFQTGGLNSDFGATFGSMGGGASDSFWGRIETFGTVAFCAVLVLSLYQVVLRTCAEAKIVVLIPIYAILSALWSQDSMLSARNGFYLLINTLFAIYLVKKFKGEQLPRLMMLIGTAAALGSIALVVLMPAYGLDHQGHEGAWQGLFSQKNCCAQSMVFLLSPAFAIEASTQKAKLLRWLYIGLVAFVVFETQSRTGWTITVLFVALMVGLQLLGRFSRQERLVIFLFGFFALAIVVVLAINYLPMVLSLLGRDSGLTGRSQIWSAVLESIGKHPLLGYGYAAFWSVLNGELSNIVLATGWVVTGAHNGFLNVWIELGAVGFGLVITMLVKAIKDAVVCFRSGRSKNIDWYIGIVFLTIVYNLDERTLVAQQTLVWLFFIMASVGLSEAARRVRTEMQIEAAGRSIWAQPTASSVAA